MFVQAISPRCVIGANYSQQNLFTFDPQLENLDYAPNMISSTQGEPMCAIGYLGKAYIGIYTQAVVSYYDPGLPFKAQHNPRELTRLYNDCRQTRPRDAAVGSGHVFISTDSDYNYLGGALVMIDPATNKCEKFNQLIKDQNLSSIAYDHCTAALWGGTDRWGQMKSAPPTQPSSLIYAFDPKSKKVVRSLTIWPGSDESLILGITAKGLLLAANPASKELAVINTQSAREIFKGPSPFGQALPLKCIRARDGQLYCVFGDRMYRWNLEKFYIEPVAKSPQCIYLTEYAPGKWILADSRSLFKLSLN
jgi:hypothetical protein